MRASFAIRTAQPADAAAIDDLLVAAFEGQAEATLVADLYVEGAVLLALVAVQEGGIAGSLLFSRLTLQDAPGLRLAALAPLAVAPARQGQGIGSALLSAGLERCRNLGLSAVVVLGDPAYYGRFGFSHASAAGLVSPYQCDAFQALALVPEATSALHGPLAYPRAFEALGDE